MAAEIGEHPTRGGAEVAMVVISAPESVPA
jgi:hypothetical protein